MTIFTSNVPGNRPHEFSPKPNAIAVSTILKMLSLLFLRSMSPFLLRRYMGYLGLCLTVAQPSVGAASVPSVPMDAFMACICPGNLASNPSFETGTSDWLTLNGTLYVDTYAAQCGDNSGQFLHNNTFGVKGGAYQDIKGVLPGSVISVDVSAGVHNNQYAAYVAVEFINSSGGWISGEYQEVDAPLPSMALYSFSNVTVPDGTDAVRLIFFTDWDWVKTDQWCLTASGTGVTNGGTIGTDQSTCSSTYDPEPLANIAPPSGGSGDLEYRWLQNTQYPYPAVGDPSWKEIPGASLPSYDPSVIAQTTCYVRCSRRAGYKDWAGISNVVSVVLDPALTGTTNGNCVTAVVDHALSSVGYKLYQNAPNPFEGHTVIGFHLPEASEATLTVFSADGRVVYTARGDFDKGKNNFDLELKDAATQTGVLYYKVSTPKWSAINKMLQEL